MINQIHQYNVLNTPWPLEDESVNCIVTSPPYYGLRDYGVSGQLGLEETLDEYIDKTVQIFREGYRVLKPTGTLWLNLGDTYAAYWGQKYGQGQSLSGTRENKGSAPPAKKSPKFSKSKRDVDRYGGGNMKTSGDVKPKDLFGVPWAVAFALRSAGWYLRSDIIWAKKNCMPESVTDRPTRSHEYIFLLSKAAKYYYDYEAIKEPALYDVDGTGTAARKARQKENNKSMPDAQRSGIRPAGFKDAEKMNGKHSDKQRGHSRRHSGFNDRWDKMTHEEQCTGMRNKRDVWTVSPAQFPEAHFATFPEQLITPCILAGCPKDGIVLDPFMGAGTTALVAKSHGRNYIGFELNPEYIKIAENRLKKEFGMFYNPLS
jgi:DNA modification methylase